MLSQRMESGDFWSARAFTDQQQQMQFFHFSESEWEAEPGAPRAGWPGRLETLTAPLLRHTGLSFDAKNCQIAGREGNPRRRPVAHLRSHSPPSPCSGQVPPAIAVLGPGRALSRLTWCRISARREEPGEARRFRSSS